MLLLHAKHESQNAQENLSNNGPVIKYSDIADHISRQVEADSKTFNCPHCSYCSNKKRIVDCHVQAVHNRTSKFQCQRCSSTFKWKWHLKRHVETVHDKLTILQCPYCSYSSARKCNLDCHLKSKHNLLSQTESEYFKSVFSCKYCNFSTVLKSLLRKHEQLAHEVPQFNDIQKITISDASSSVPEDICQVFLVDNSIRGCREDGVLDITEPLATLIGGSKDFFTCDQCKFSTSYMQSLKRHVQSIHDNIRFQCQHCDTSYSQKTKLTQSKHNGQLEEWIGPISFQEFSSQESHYQAFVNVNDKPEENTLEEVVDLMIDDKPQIVGIYSCTWCSDVCKVSKEAMDMQENHSLTLEEYVEMNKITFA